MLADVTVAKCSKSEAAHADDDGYVVDYANTFITRTHLGHILSAGDYAKGYDLHSTNFNSDLYEELVQAVQSSSSLAEIPDVILVKKMYINRRRGGKQRRHWKLKRLAENNNMEMDEETSKDKAKRGEKERREQEWEGFLQELEEDKELRGMINLYRGMPGGQVIWVCLIFR